MADKKQPRLSSDDVEADLLSFTALQSLSDYASNNADYSMAKAADAQKAVTEAHAAEKHAEDAVNAARDKSAAAERTLHDLMIGVKTQVKGQYGESSDALAALGVKKKNEYKRPSGRPKKNA